jgi:hypothetical protein
MEGRGTRSVEEIFEDFKSRRAGIIKALTTGTNFFNYDNQFFNSFLDLQLQCLNSIFLHQKIKGF